MKERETNMLALGRLITKHDDGATVGYVEVDASNVVVVALELIVCVLAFVQLIDNDNDGLDANDVVEFDTFAEVAMTCSPATH